ncbi:MAG: TrkA C-terminal domain-containing protein [Methanothrix sp.]
MELVDFIAKAGSKIIGKSVSKELPKDSLVGMILRDGRPMMPDDGFKVKEGDRVFVMSMPEVVSKVKRLFVS